MNQLESNVQVDTIESSLAAIAGRQPGSSTAHGDVQVATVDSFQVQCSLQPSI